MRAVFCCAAYAFLLAQWLLCLYCFYSRGQAYSSTCVGECHRFLFRFLLCIIWCSFFLPIVEFLQYLAVTVELELLGGSSSPFSSYLVIATHHLRVTLKHRGGVRAGGLLQRRGESWCIAPAEMNVNSSVLPLWESRSAGLLLGALRGYRQAW